jgi:hypothetical protein
MVRETFSRQAAVVAVTALVALSFGGARLSAQTRSTGAAAVAEAVLWGLPMAPAERMRELPVDVQVRVAEYRIREESFRTGLKRAPNESPEERSLFEKRVGIERVIFCLFPRRDIARVAASYASDTEVADEWEGLSEPPRREAAFIDSLLRDLPQPWLAPYLNLLAGHRKLCASQLEGPQSPAERDAIAADGRAHLTRARDGGHPIIRLVAGHLLMAGRCIERR